MYMSVSSLTGRLPASRNLLLRLDLLNFKLNELPSRLVRGRSLVLIFIVCRALGGRWARKIRQVFPRLEKGLNLVETSVMNLVIMVAENSRLARKISHIVNGTPRPTGCDIYLVTVQAASHHCPSPTSLLSLPQCNRLLVLVSE